MFIRELVRKDHQSGKVYVYHRLVEAVRTPRGPRHRMVLDLGHLDLPKDQWKGLANRIEEILSGQERFHDPEGSREALAQAFARRIIRKERMSILGAQAPSQWERIDLGSLSQEEVRSVGAEAVGCWAFEKLRFPQILSRLGLSPPQRQVAALLIMGRLLHPASERRTLLGARQVSALEEVLGTDLEKISLSALYRTSDELLRHREAIEGELAQNERDLFGLGEKIVLYDLTNTYLMGSAKESSLSQRGWSKQKRHDCPLVTLALVLDEDGFPKASRVFAGNVSEPQTLRSILEALPIPPQMLLTPRTVVLDAGVATEENLSLIRSYGMDYVVVSRRRPEELPPGEHTLIQDDGRVRIEGIRLEQEGETLLFCHSTGRAAKEAGIRSRFQSRWEEALQGISDSLQKPRGRKRYERVIERLGRLRERYATLAQFYEITVDQAGGKATRLSWHIPQEEKLALRFSGAYLIRSSRKDWDEKQLWSLYNMLTSVEESFRALKSELGLRPLFHRVDRRLEGHLFITVCAYHLLVAIQRELRKRGIHHRWDTIRTQMRTQCRVTVSLRNDRGQRILVRQTTEPEPFHKEVYRALGLPMKPLSPKKVIF